MSKFKVGDKVKCVYNASITSLIIGKVYTVTETSNGEMVTNLKEFSLREWSIHSSMFELINNKNITNMKEKFIQMFLKEPEKSFRKAGITNGDGLITEEGQTIFLSWLLGKNGEAFKTEVVDGLLLEEKDK